MSKEPARVSPRIIVLLLILAALSVVAVIRNFGRDGIAGPRMGSQALAFTPRELPVLEADTRQQVETGAGSDFARNPFVFGAPPTPTRNLTPPPTRAPLAPRTPRPTPTQHVVMVDGTPKPPPPPFDRTFIGFFGPKRLQVAAFKKDDKLEVAVEGDVLDDIFIIRKIGLESVEIGFVGYTEEENTRVPLAKKD